MFITFETPSEYYTLWQSVHDSILYWKKVRQAAQGKICIHPDGSDTHYDEQYATGMMIESASLLKKLEDTPHPEWDADTETYYTTSKPEYYSSIITKTLALSPVGDSL